MLVHLVALIGFLGVPFGNLLGPLVIWLCFRAEDPAVESNGKESLNFQISMTLYGLVAFFLVFLLVGFVILPVLLVADVVLVILAAIAASKGETYRYPFTLRFVQ